MNSSPLTPDSPREHVYKPGEKLVDIAISHGLSLEELTLANGLTEASMLFPGQKLLIPSRVLEPKPKTAATEHLVLAGETLYGIADKYGINVADLMEINHLPAGAMIFPGLVLSLVTEAKVPEISSSRFPKHCLVHGYHKVTPGDQINRIAAFHGVSTQALLTANELGWNSVVSPGSKLVIPISHTPLTCPSLVQLSTTAMQLAENLYALATVAGLDEYGYVVALCLEMQRSGLLPELGNKQLSEELVIHLAKVVDLELLNVNQALAQAGYAELAEGAMLWEPSAWLWLHQVRSKK